MRSGLVFTCLVIFLLATALVDAKKAKGKEKKADKAVKESKTKEAKPEKVQPKKKVKVAKPVEEPVHEEVEEEIPVELKEPVVEQCSKPVHQTSCGQTATGSMYAKPRIAKPKTVKTLTEYEQCKLECKRKRDDASVVQYVDQLRAELAQAEAALLEQEQQEAARIEAEAKIAATTEPLDKPLA